MKVLGIDCSQKVKEGVSHNLLTMTLQKIEELGGESDIVRLIDYELELCRGCNNCVESGQCPITDEFDALCTKLATADALVFSSPVYWGRYPTIVSCFIDRMRKITGSPHPLFRKHAGLIVQSVITDNALTIGSFGQLFKSFGMINVISVGIGMIEYEKTPEDDKNAQGIAQLVGERVFMGLKSDKIRKVFG